MKALGIRLSLAVPDAVIDLGRLAAHRRALGAEPFTRLLTQAADGTDLDEAITSLLDQVDETGGMTGMTGRIVRGNGALSPVTPQPSCRNASCDAT